MSDNDGSEYGCLYDDGYWEWNEEKEMLLFTLYVPRFLVTYQPVEDIICTTEAAAGAVQFRDDIDVYEQLRFKNRYQRKVKFGHREVVTIQDVKDVALFTAPMSIMSEKLIFMLHQPTTERFIRALILYCQYYLQIDNTMSQRLTDLERKIRTPQSKIVEDEYRENLCDLRLLVAKEYCTISLGAADMKRYHHMATSGRTRSLSDQDAHLYETLLRICIQMVWLALGRKSYIDIELEVNRLFKSDLFNSAEHNLRTKYLERMPAEKRDVLLGHCLLKDKRNITRSPLVNEIFCHRHIDFRLMSLGVVQHEQLSRRNLYLQYAIAEHEETFELNNVVVGILGLNRTKFDAMLHPVAIHRSAMHKSQSQSTLSFRKIIASFTRKSGMDVRQAAKTIYPDIVLPLKEEISEALPEIFPTKPAIIRRRRYIVDQRDKWLNRFYRRLQARKSTRE